MLCFVGEPVVEVLKAVVGHSLEDAFQSTVFMLTVLKPSLLLFSQGIKPLLREPRTFSWSAQSQYVRGDVTDCAS